MLFSLFCLSSTKAIGSRISVYFTCHCGYTYSQTYLSMYRLYTFSNLSIYIPSFVIHTKDQQWISFSQDLRVFDLPLRLYTFSNLSIYVPSFVIHTRDQQWIGFSLLVSIHEILNTSESTILKFNYSDPFVLYTTLIYKYEYNIDIELMPFEICLIHMPTHLDS